MEQRGVMVPVRGGSGLSTALSGRPWPRWRGVVEVDRLLAEAAAAECDAGEVGEVQLQWLRLS